MRFLIRIVLAVVLFTSVTQAQVFWENAFGPWGGEAHDLSEAPDGRMFTAAENGLFLSGDDGESWQLFAFPDQDVTFFTVTRSGIMIATVERSLLLSVDAGTSWKVVLEDVIGGVFEHSTGLLIARSTQSLLYYSYGGVTWFAYDDQHFSKPDPESWTETPQGEILAGQLVITLKAGTLDIVRVRDLSTPTVTYRPDAITTTGGSHRIARCPSPLDRTTTLLHSSDDGKRWQFVREASMEHPSWSAPFVVSSSGDGRVLLFDEDLGVLRSTDYGASWASLPASFGWSRDITDVLISTSGSMFFSCNTNAVSRWDAFSGTWLPKAHGVMRTVVRQVHQHADGEYYAILPLSEEIRSSDDLLHWQFRKTFPAPLNCLCFPSDGSIIAALSGDTIRKSTDGGSSWRTLPLGETGINTVEELRDGRLLAGGTSGLYLSTDMGESWEDVSSLRTFNIEAIHERIGGDIVIGGEEGVYFGSGDLMDWRLSRPSWYAVMTLEESASGQIFAGTVGDGIYFSDDDGMSWAHGGLDGEWITGIVAPDDAYCFASTREHGVFEFRDGGATWTAYSSGLQSPEIFDLYPGRDAYLYAATGSGVARSQYRVLSSDYLRPSLTLQLYGPNPFASSTVFTWSVPRAGRARMMMYDVLGRMLRVEFDRQVEAGVHWHTISADGLLPGTYFCVLSFEGETIDRKFQVVR